ncbi:DUF1284 domain-containing protein [Romboutsia weinsteinii]|uniref:DUF1284 domain-containing protein n=1 Tax=Romboutsia weinsteinii TaxID=2020949 RepID=A0A371IXM2_9FIRM|nr:DUF1284 domain-containing protein [Romboutsia weinsteinii]RDY25226.1 DUF1284 domain-containing protein [Romboutsia weinsteinii]
MIKIRPHHILCMRAYQGRGYSEEFGINMEKVIEKIGVFNRIYNNTNEVSEEKIEKVQVVFGLDSLCAKCPHNVDEETCVTEAKVNTLDYKVVNYFNIKEGIYNYKELENLVYDHITEEIFDDICINCSWYNTTNCKSFIL